MIPAPNPIMNEDTPLLLGPGVLKEATIYIYLVSFISAIGGFLFGYDTGIISGAMIFIRDVFDLNEWWQESIVSSTLLFAWLFSILSSSANDRFGRKPVIIVSSVIFVIGSVLMCIAWDEIILVAGRMVVGAGVGLSSMTVPMYIAEVAPSSIRGQLVLINMSCITGGQFFASILAYWFSFIKGGEGWRYMLGFAAIPAAIQFFAFLAMPESPRWLIGKKRYDDARQVLMKLRPKHADIETELESIKENDLQAKRQQDAQNDPNQSTFKRILNNQPVRKALMVGCLLQAVQQLSGINTVMYYSATIFEMSGVYSKHEALILSAGTALVNFIFTLVGLYLVERMGRRKLTLYSLFGVVVSLSILAAGFQFAYYNSPKVTEVENSDINHPCNLLSDCSTCSRKSECGFCFAPSPSSDVILSGSCLHVNSTNHDRSVIGKCFQGTTANEIWAVEWCPSAYSWVTLLGMVSYLLFFAPGIGPMPWIINSEIYPTWARSWCLSATTSVNWLFNLLVSMTFLSLTRLITKQGAFYLYALVASIGFVFFVVVLPETRGKTLEELENLFATKRESKKQNKNIKVVTK